MEEHFKHKHNGKRLTWSTWAHDGTDLSLINSTSIIDHLFWSSCFYSIILLQNHPITDYHWITVVRSNKHISWHINKCINVMNGMTLCLALEKITYINLICFVNSESFYDFLKNLDDSFFYEICRHWLRKILFYLYMMFWNLLCLFYAYPLVFLWFGCIKKKTTISLIIK